MSQPESPPEPKVGTGQDLYWYENFPKVCLTIGAVSILCLAIHWGLKTYASSEVADSMPNFVLKEIGFAGLVALILNLSIEWVNRKRHLGQQESLLQKLDVKHEQTSQKLLTDVNKQLFKTIYERNIDPSVFQQVEDHLLRAKVMRKDFLASFKIEPFHGEGETKKYVKLSLVTSYRVFNLTDKPIHVDVARGVVDMTPEFKEHCFFSRVTLGEEEIKKDDLLKNKHVEDLPNRNFITLKIEREVPPHDSLPVTLEYTKLAPIDYSEIVVSTIPMDQLTIEVVDTGQNFTVEAVSLHPEAETLKTPPDQRHLRRWKIEHAILPGQGIVLMWHPHEVNLPHLPSA